MTGTTGTPTRHDDTRHTDTRRTPALGAAVGLARRSIVNITRLPSAFLPSVLMPVFQAVAFAGTFFAIIQIPGFPTDRSINWFLPLSTLMGSGFAGIGIGFSTIRDLETGFYDRIRLTPAPRSSLITGPLFAALVRSIIVTFIVVVVGVLFGARPTHGLYGMMFLFLAGLGVAALGTGWGLGLAFRFGDMRGAAIMQLSFFLLLFLTDAQTPLFIMEGWLEAVARINPFTNIIRLGRLGFLDAPITWDNIWGGLVALFAIVTLTLLFARRSLDRLNHT